MCSFITVLIVAYLFIQDENENENRWKIQHELGPFLMVTSDESNFGLISWWADHLLRDTDKLIN